MSLTAPDSVTSLGQGWSLDVGGPISQGDTLYNSYTLGEAQLLIDVDLTQNIS